MDRENLIDALALIAWNSEPKNAQTIMKAISVLKEQEGIISALKSDLKETLEVVSGQLNVVHCKDCKYNDDGECIIKAGWFPVKPDWFCADGERLE